MLTITASLPVPSPPICDLASWRQVPWQFQNLPGPVPGANRNPTNNHKRTSEIRSVSEQAAAEQGWDHQCVRVHESSVIQLHPTLCDPMDCSLPGSSVHGIFQARILEWVAIPFSRGSSQPRDQTYVSCIGKQNFLPLYHLLRSLPTVQSLPYSYQWNSEIKFKTNLNSPP